MAMDRPLGMRGSEAWKQYCLLVELRAKFKEKNMNWLHVQLRNVAHKKKYTEDFKKKKKEFSPAYTITQESKRQAKIIGHFGKKKKK